MSSRVCCIKEKPYWYDRVIPTVQPYKMYFDFYSLDVAWQGGTSVLSEADNTTDQCVSPTIQHIKMLCMLGGCIPLLLSKVALQQWFMLQIKVFLLCFGPCLWTSNTQSSTWNSSFIWSLGYATKIIINLFSVKL